MKPLSLLKLLPLALLALTACKTNEANYRAAYQSARQAYDNKNNSNNTGNDNNDNNNDNIASSFTAARLTTPSSRAVVGDSGTTLDVRRMRVNTIPISPEAQVTTYYLVVNGFKQQFNATSLARRLSQQGFITTLLETGEPYYFVAIAGADNIPQFEQPLHLISTNTTVPPKDGFPFILQPVN